MTISLRIAVLCGGQTAFPALEALRQHGVLAGVAFAGQDAYAWPQLVQFASGAGIACEDFSDRQHFPLLGRWLRLVQPDLVLVIGFPRRIPADWLALFPGRWLNFHGGPLPQYRGANPMFEVLRAQEAETALCVHHLEAGFDTGAIVLRVPIPLAPEETFLSLATQMTQLYAQAAIAIAGHWLQHGSIPPGDPQDEALARYYPKPTLQAQTVDWHTMTAAQIHALVRACDTWTPGAQATLGGKPALLQQVQPHNQHSDLPPATQLATEPLRMVCAAGTVLDIIRHTFAG